MTAQIRPGGCQVGFSVSEPDLITEFSICRADGISLFGPVPRQMIGEVPAEWVLEMSDAQLARWQEIGDDPAHAELTVLTSCRMWQFVKDGVPERSGAQLSRRSRETRRSKWSAKR
jgi:hypothetical protein